MITFSETPFLWQKDSSWWDYDEDGYTVHLNDNAPDFARESFKEYVEKFGNEPDNPKNHRRKKSKTKE